MRKPARVHRSFPWLPTLPCAGVAILTSLTMCTSVITLGTLGACTTVDGGAVDLSWRLRTADGAEISDDHHGCEDARIAAMRLHWDVEGVTGSASWPCEDVRAITGFEVPPGRALLWLEPACVSGEADPASYEAPAPLERTITVGDVITLNAVVVSVQLSPCDEQPCVCR